MALPRIGDIGLSELGFPHEYVSFGGAYGMSAPSNLLYYPFLSIFLFIALRTLGVSISLFLLP